MSVTALRSLYELSLFRHCDARFATVSWVVLLSLFLSLVFSCDERDERALPNELANSTLDSPD